MLLLDFNFTVKKAEKRLESLFNTAYGVVKAGKPFSDYELICEIQIKNGLDLGENYRNINGCKTFDASIAQTLVDKQVKFQILSYKSLTGLGFKKFKKPWAWACPKKFQPLYSCNKPILLFNGYY